MRRSLRASAGVLRGELPPRYQRSPLAECIEDVLRPGMQVLDAGAGAHPTIEPAARPPECRYVGLDISRTELGQAAPGSYDELAVSDLAGFDPALEERFDLIVSLFTLEHVDSLPLAVANMRGYLRMDGWLVALLSGRFSYFAVANAVLPARIKAWLLERLLNRPRETVFPAHYDCAWYAALRKLLSEGWAEWEVIPCFSGAFYLCFSRWLMAVYLAYEEWVVVRRHPNLATSYLIVAHAPTHRAPPRAVANVARSRPTRALPNQLTH